MCFTTARTTPLKARVATKDIKVFKKLIKGTTRFRSPIKRGCIWEVRKVKVAKGFVEKLGYKGQNLGRGLHSFRTSSAARAYSCSGEIFNAVIPKGAIYYSNETQFISNKLKIVSVKPVKA